MPSPWNVYTQFWPPKATLTEQNIASQTGKVFIITGGSSGIGYELSRILYGAGGTVYMLTRTKSNAEDAIRSIEKSFASQEKTTLGQLEFIMMDLEDLESVKTAAQEFTWKEKRLDVLYNNAGVSCVVDKKTKQELEYQCGVNSVGHVLLEKLLRPVMTETSKSSPKDSVRVVWAASVLVDLNAPIGGVAIEKLDTHSTDITETYVTSKTGNWFIASEFSKREGHRTGVLDIAVNPGSYVTNVWRNTPWYLYYPFYWTLRYPIHGAYTYLWCGLSDEVTMKDAVAGRYATCDGRWHPGQREDLLLALKSEDEGGTGQAKAFFDWCESKVAPFV
ncbi:NAD(P)-binding protein [Polyplosphaeria fusca]|uniref:NAD(P)-binding protein n=1 Tax=Polyplosphaeria fusca TaxID=682080 RepID=A0A9P4QJV4_9PLEO|nr:NAD(P)-binding protein [Polyplosphaeria fusca]